jgi:hypothetical protein
MSYTGLFEKGRPTARDRSRYDRVTHDRVRATQKSALGIDCRDGMWRVTDRMQ